MVWNYTPAQANAYLKLGDRRKKREDASLLWLQATALRGAEKDINRKIMRDGQAE